MANLNSALPSGASERIRCLAANIDMIRVDLLNGKVPGPVKLHDEAEYSAYPPLFVEMEKTVSLIPEAFVGTLSLGPYAPPQAGADPGVKLFRADAVEP